MLEKNHKVWLNGTLVPFSETNLSPLTHTLHYGSGVFEGIRAYETTDNKTHIFRLEEHVDRLFYSAEKIFLEIPYSKSELMEACHQAVTENNLSEAYIRPIVYFDDSSMGINPTKNSTHVFIAAWAWGQYLADSVSVEVSDYRRISEKSTICDAKISGHYVNSILATVQAKRNGYLEALLLDHNDNIAEGPGENIFFIKGKELHTPKLGKILAGITRDSVITFTSNMGYTTVERDITLDEVADFDSAFFTGTAAEISPIDKIDQKGKTLAEYDLTAANEIKQTFFNIVCGQEEDYKDWLSFPS